MENTAPAANLITLTFNGTMGTLTLTPSDGTFFRMDDSVGVYVASPCSLSMLVVTASTFAVALSNGYAGQIVVGIQLGSQAQLIAGGNFTPDSIVCTWIGQMGGPEALSAGSGISITQ